jgi:RNA polymerase sigma factor (sigma-70 family)
MRLGYVCDMMLLTDDADFLDTVDPARSVEDSVVSSDQRELMRYMLAHLSEREEAIVTMRLDLLDDPDMPTTYAAIGRHYGISTERVRQIYMRALDRMQVAALKSRYTGSSSLIYAVNAFVAA